jgi:cysteine desulfurase/selenocysteine lyase
MPIGLSASEISPDQIQDRPVAPGEAPGFPDTSIIARMANAFFHATPNQTALATADPGLPLIPPTPAYLPAPNVVTSAALVTPANPLVGPPDLPPSTIASIAPTPNLVSPPAPRLSAFPPGLGDPPTPGASVGSDSPFDAPLGEIVQLVPSEHRAGPVDSQDGLGNVDAYFLNEATLLSARPEHAAGPAFAETPPAIVTLQAANAPQAPDAAAGAIIPFTAPLAPGDAAPFAPADPRADIGDSKAGAPRDAAAAYFLDDVSQFSPRQDALAAPAFNTDLSSAAPSPKTDATPRATYNFLELDLRPLAAPARGALGHPLDPDVVRRDFPILEERVNGGKKLIWLDNAATTQKPLAVIDRISEFYKHENSNIHRAAHALAARSTDAYEAAREKVRRFLNAPSARDIVFVRGATEGVNLVAQSWGRANIVEGDEILVSHLEHHANIVPWQQLCAQTGAKLRVAPVDDSGQIILDAYERLLGPKTRIVAVSQVSNALGTVTPVAEMTALAHKRGACVLIDGAQAVSHMPVDVQAIGCDFYVFSGHKVFGPTGIGAVYGRDDVLAKTPPWQGGGNMIADVTFEKTVFQAPPERFEAGTGNIADAVGLGAAIDYVESLGMANIAAYEHGLLEYATAKMRAVPRLKMIGTAREKASVLSFVIEGKDTIEIGKALDAEGIAVRSGHHCAQPILRRFGLESTVRPSLAFYNTCEEVDALIDVLLKLQSRN